MSFLRRIWQKLTNPTGFVGKDLEGNKYYEYPNPLEATRTKRVVKYRKGYDMWTYVAGGKRLPVQWSSWLTHTRPHAPTLKELQADLVRQQRVLLGAAMIEARERRTIGAPASLSQREPFPSTIHRSASSNQSSPSGNGTAAPPTWQGKPNPFAQVPKGADEPQAWSPRAVRRG